MIERNASDPFETTERIVSLIIIKSERIAALPSYLKDEAQKDLNNFMAEHFSVLACPLPVYNPDILEPAAISAEISQPIPVLAT